MSVGGTGKGYAGAQMVVRRAEPEPELEPQGMSAPVVLTNPMDGRYKELAMENLRMLLDYGLEAPRHDEFHGKVLALCGAGPSLADGPIYPADEVWGCNSAVHWLAENHTVTGAVAIDQTERMVDEWADTPDVTHYIASTINPGVTRDLIRRGRRVRVFHNYVGWGDDEGADEKAFYNSAPWPASFMMGHGATVVPRTIGLAAWMGFRRIDVYGADCHFPDDVVHANGEGTLDAFGYTTIVTGEIDGTEYRTRLDLLLSAVDLVRLVKAYPDRIRLMGDTLPVALMGFDDSYLDRVICRTLPGETVEEVRRRVLDTTSFGAADNGQ